MWILSSRTSRARRGSGYAVAEAVVAAVLWGSIGVVYRLGVGAGCSGAWLVAGRPLAASLLSLYLAIRGSRPSVWSVAVGMLGLAPLYAAYFLAVERLGAGLASILLYTAPVWVTLLSPVIGERVTPAGWLAAVAGFLGVSMLAWPSGGGLDVVGLLLGLASGASYAAYILLARLGQKRGAGVKEVSVHAFPFAAAAVLAAERPRGAPSPLDVAYMTYLAVAGTIVPYVLNARALSRLDAHRVAVISLVEPLTATLLAYAVLGEKLTLLQTMGAVLVLVSSLLAARSR